MGAVELKKYNMTLPSYQLYTHGRLSPPVYRDNFYGLLYIWSFFIITNCIVYLGGFWCFILELFVYLKLYHNVVEFVGKRTI